MQVKRDKLTDAEARAILKAAEENRRDWLILRLYIQTGARLREILDATVGDIRWESRTIYVPPERSKNGEPGELLFNDNMETPLKQWVRDNKLKPNDRIFSITGRGFEYAIKRYVKAAGITKVVTPQSLRSFFGTAVYKVHPDMPLVARFLRQKTVSVADEHYVNIVTNEMREWHKKITDGW